MKESNKKMPILWVGSNRFDLIAVQVASASKLHRQQRNIPWLVEATVQCRSPHLKKTPCLMIQMMTDLITYLLLAISCHEGHNQPIFIR